MKKTDKGITVAAIETILQAALERSNEADFVQALCNLFTKRGHKLELKLTRGRAAKKMEPTPIAKTIRVNGDPDIGERLDQCVAGGGPYGGAGPFCKGCGYKHDLHRSRVAARAKAS